MQKGTNSCCRFFLPKKYEKESSSSDLPLRKMAFGFGASALEMTSFHYIQNRFLRVIEFTGKLVLMKLNSCTELRSS
jgi:hypothetical protein